MAAWIVLGCALASCVGEGRGALEVQWTFADGRDCFSSGVERVELTARHDREEAGSAVLLCTSGFAPDVANAGTLPAGVYTLTLEGKTAEGATLYRREGFPVRVASDGDADVWWVELGAVDAQAQTLEAR